jgi:hypothetical protein
MFDIAFILLAVVINVYILMYLYHLEKIGCECAINWRRTFIMFVIGLSLVLSILSVFSIDVLTSASIMTLFSVLSIANVVVILQYVHLLKKEQCKCSESLAREIMQVIAILYAFFYIMLFIVLFYAGFKLSTIVAMSKQLSTNNPKVMASELGKTLKTVSKTAKKALK